MLWCVSVKIAEGDLTHITGDRLRALELTIKRRALKDPKYAADALVGLVRQAADRNPAGPSGRTFW